MCVQDNKFEGKEDCLVLNVFTPDVGQVKLKAVMFFVHGGSYETGDGYT